MTVPWSLNRTTGPASEPVTTAEAKKHLELRADDTTHDSAVDDFIAAAREQVEHDTGYALITQVHTLTMSSFPDRQWSGNYPSREPEIIHLGIRPVQSITSITYYDADNSQQTLGTSVYGFNAAQRVVFLKYDQEWPSITEQYGGIVITMSTGYGAASAVPNLFKQAILCQVQAWFDPYQRPGCEQAYEFLVRRIRDPAYV